MKQPFHSRNGQALWYRQKASALFISDLDALRGTYGLKGSSGIKPCLWCQNILKKNSSLQDDRFREIHEHDSSKFEIATNESLWAMCDHLQERMPHMNQETRGRMEKSMGVTYIPGSILFDHSVRSKLQPSDVCLDSMHNYFSNGVCSYELGQFWDAVVKETPLTLDSLFQACREAQWQGPRVSKHGAACYMKSLWSEKMWSPEQFKGQAEQCESIMPLMRWYAEMFLSHVASLHKKLESLRALSDIVQEFRKQTYMWRPIDQKDCQELEKLQSLHQQKFCLAYGNSACKPKHHHRFHIGSSWLRLGVALCCKPMESKHKCYKRGVAERFQNKVEKGFAEALLPRILHTQAESMPTHWPDGVQAIRLLRPWKNAPLNIQSAYPCWPSCKVASGVKIFNSCAKPGDVLFFNDIGGILEHILHNGAGEAVFMIQVLHLDSRLI